MTRSPKARSEPKEEAPPSTSVTQAPDLELDPTASAMPVDPAKRRVGRVSASQPARRAKPSRTPTAALFEPLDSDDAAIPWSRVPYVPADLRRVAIIGALMVLLIVVADVIVSTVIH